MLMQDIKNLKFTVLCSASGYVNNDYMKKEYNQTDMTLMQIIQLGNQWKKNIDCLRNMDVSTTEKYNHQRNVKTMFPCWFVGGVFPYKKQCDEDIITLSNVLAIDIDYKDNVDIDFNELKKTLFALPYTIMISDSIRGKGIYQLILVEDGRFTEQYYEYIKKLYKQQYGINVDGVAKNIGRKRFISYDDNLLIKDDNIDIKPWKLKIEQEKKESTEIQPTLFNYKIVTNANQVANVELLDKTIKFLVDNGFSVDDFNSSEKYAIWYYVGCDFHALPNGLNYFIKFSNNSRYNDTYKDIERKYNNGQMKDTIENICRKYCGIAKNKYGKDWVKLVCQ